MTYRAVHNPNGASVILDDNSRNIAVIHSDGKTMTPAFEPELAARIVRGLALLDVLDAANGTVPKAIAA